jgi:hypothetical protein
MFVIEGVMFMKKMGMIIYMIAGMLSLITAAFPETTAEQQDQGQVVVTVLPKKGRESSVNILQQDLQLKVNGKASNITGWLPLREHNNNLEMVILIDSSARASLGLQFGEIAGFIRSLSPDVKVAVGYMNAGRAVLAGPLSTNQDEAVNKLRIPGAAAGSNASPYFCLSDLAKHWPSADHSARRDVVLITDGVDNYGQRLDLNDPYVKTAIDNSISAGLVVYSIFWPNRNYTDRSGSESFDGQNLLAQVTQATGGYSYGTGGRQPVSFNTYFDDIAWRLKNQYRLSFRSLLKGKPQVQAIELKVNNSATEVYAPQRVFIMNSSGE